MRDEPVVIEASALLDLMISPRAGPALSARIDGCSLHAPGHLDVEVLASLGHLEQTGSLSSDAVARYAETMAAAPIERHAVAGLMAGAWRQRTISRCPWPSMSNWRAHSAQPWSPPIRSSLGQPTSPNSLARWVRERAESSGPAQRRR